MLESIPLIAAYMAGSAGVSAIMAKASPTIGLKIRHIFSGIAPMAVVFASLLDGQESVTLHGDDILFAGGLFCAGLVSSVLTAKALRGRAIRDARADI